MRWYRFVSHGKVQGVYYRKFVADAMRKAGFQGYVRNLPDGTVETVVFLHDEDEEMPTVTEILKKGSPLSRVERIDVEPVDDITVESDGFTIRY